MFGEGEPLPAPADVKPGADGPVCEKSTTRETCTQPESGYCETLFPGAPLLQPNFDGAPPTSEGDDPAGRLINKRPDLSAASPMWTWQKWTISLLFGALAGGAVFTPQITAIVVTLALAVPFFSVYLLRGLAIAALMKRDRKTSAHFDPMESDQRSSFLVWSHFLRRTGFHFVGKCSSAHTGNEPGSRFRPDSELPTYAVLVPLYDEAEIVPSIVAALGSLDYPNDKLAIRFVLEAADGTTRQAFEHFALPPHMSVFVAPPGKPRTKPRALNLALDVTPGAFVVVYDAEDQPEADQLKRAVAAFDAAPDGTACMQARLNTFNPNESWLSRQFTIEYSALFDVLLPALERFRLPVPLGGTSNHFRREALEDVLAWDPFNVTEDADLGIRLARFGKRVGTFESTTWEEAPPNWKIWLGQRTRWLKGWMQTYLVHMRAPTRLKREIGWWPFWGVQMLMGAMIASALVHPWLYMLLGFDALAGNLFANPQGLEKAFWLLAVANLLLGYLSVVAVGAVAVWRRGRRWLLPHLILVPVYWLAISIAAYKALVELFVAPYHWEKTKHRAWINGPGGSQA